MINKQALEEEYKNISEEIKRLQTRTACLKNKLNDIQELINTEKFGSNIKEGKYYSWEEAEDEHIRVFIKVSKVSTDKLTGCTIGKKYSEDGKLTGYNVIEEDCYDYSDLSEYASNVINPLKLKEITKEDFERQLIQNESN